MLFEERHVLGGGFVLEAAVGPGARYRLRYGRPGAWLVHYEDGWRRVRGRARRYAFRSVEQLRYDFERDVAHAQPQG
jgi:hypothetical protein